MIYESLKDRLVNTILQFKSWIRYTKKSYHFGNDEPNTKLMNCRFSDNFKFFDKNKWRISQPWGRFHTGNPTQYGKTLDSYHNKSNLLHLCNSCSGPYSPLACLKMIWTFYFFDCFFIFSI